MVPRPEGDHPRAGAQLDPGHAARGSPLGPYRRCREPQELAVVGEEHQLVIVTDETLWRGSTDPEQRVFGVKNGNTTALEFGGYIRFQYQTELAKNITFMTRGDVFSNYLREPGNMDVTWETLWTFKVNDWFAATLNTVLLYDHDTDINRFDDAGTTYLGPATQFKQSLGIGLTFKL